MLDEKEETARKRASRLIQCGLRSTSLKNIGADFRWDEIEGLVFANSKLTDFWYVIDPLRGLFFRTKAKGTLAIESDSPRGVIERDRAWLYPFLNTVPGGRAVLDRYDAGKAPTLPTPPKKDHAMEKVQMPGPTSNANGFKPIVTTATRRIVLTEHARVVTLAPHDVVQLLRATGAEVPDKAEVTMKNGYINITWTDTQETQEG
jgi:hypothetical protein